MVISLRAQFICNERNASSWLNPSPICKRTSHTVVVSTQLSQQIVGKTSYFCWLNQHVKPSSAMLDFLMIGYFNLNASHSKLRVCYGKIFR